MTVSYQQILDALCSSPADPITSNDSQSSFSIPIPQEAQLAYDVLAAYGFDVQVYHENNASKLYINRPQLAPEALEKKLESALSHARTLKQVVHTMNGAENSTYQISFTNTPTLGKQISIYFPPASTFAEELPDDIKPSTQQRPAVVPHNPQQIPRKKNGQNQPRRPKSETLETGPALAKQYPFGIKPPKTHEDSVMKWLSTYVFSNFTESFYAFFGMFFAVLIIISMLVIAKAFVCADLATVKSQAWYCN